MQMADVTIHLHETLDAGRRGQIADTIRSAKGVMGVANHEHTAHLMVIEYDPATIKAHDLLRLVTDGGVHAELVGL